MKKNYKYFLMFLLLLLVTTGCANHKKWWSDYGISDPQYLKDPSSIPSLVDALDDPDLRTRNKAVRYLKLNNDESVVEPVKEMVRSDSHENNRREALVTFYQLPLRRELKADFFKEQATDNSMESVRTLSGKLLFKLRITEGVGTARLIFSPQEYIEVKISPKFRFYNGWKKINISEGLGVLPIEVSISNYTSEKLRISPDKILLFSDNAGEREPISIEDAIDKQLYSHSLAVLRGPWSLGRSISANVKIDQFCRRNDFNHKYIKPYSVVTGIVFFNIDKNNIDITDNKIKVFLFNEDRKMTHVIKYKFWDDISMQSINVGNSEKYSKKNKNNKMVL